MKYSYRRHLIKRGYHGIVGFLFHDATKQCLEHQNDSRSQSRSPNKEIVPKMNQARNNKFHKLFKELPKEEICIKGYSCAFLGDILIQGFLYISPNYFCFHSKILGIEKQIKIPVKKVLNITREKTAIFIPNAIGVVTSEDKYVFGSLLQRDNTYRLMFTVWKTLTQPDGANKATLADIDVSLDDGETGEHNNNISKTNGSLDSSAESENSVCITCGLPVNEHSGGDPCGTGSCDDVMGGGAGRRSPLVAGAPSRTPPPTTKSSSSSTMAVRRQQSKQSSTSPSASTSLTNSSSPPPQTTTSSNTNVSQESKASVMGSLLQGVRQIPKTHLLLSLCVVMVIILAVCAVIMLNKILFLQHQLDTDLTASTALPLESQGMYGNMYHLNQEYHTSAIKRFHSVLEANIQVLDQIFASLKGLHHSVAQSCKGNDCTGSENFGTFQTKNT